MSSRQATAARARSLTLLVVDSLTRQFPTRGAPLEVLRGVTFALEAGESAAIVGPSGSGKSTLLHVIGTLDRPTSGRVLVDGADPFQLDEPALAAFRNRQIGFVFQDHHLLPQCTVIENVLVPTLASGITDDDIVRARMLVERIGLGERLDHRPAELSGGERQRVAIARALVRRPRLVLADEPTGNLDRTTANEVSTLLLDLQRDEGTALLVVTHSLELAGRLGRCWELDEGRFREAS